MRMLVPRALLAMLLIGASDGALAQDVGDAQRGLAYARENCARCHAVERDAISSQMPGLATFSTIANTPGMTGLALAVWLQSTHREMPNFVIPPDDRNDLIAYILSLKEKR